MALHRLGPAGFLCLAVLWACGAEKTQGQSTARPVVEVMPDAKATADVDRRATLALKQSLSTTYPQTVSSEILEAGLVKEGYACGANPAADLERACLKTKREGACEVNMIIRSQPYLPEKAQVIRICEVPARAE